MQAGIRRCLEHLDSVDLLLTVEREVDPNLEIPSVFRSLESIW